MRGHRRLALAVTVAIAALPLCACGSAGMTPSQADSGTVESSTEGREAYETYIRDPRVSTVLTGINADMSDLIDAIGAGDQSAADAATHSIRERRDALAEMEDVPTEVMTLHEATVNAATEYKDAADNYDVALALALSGDSKKAERLMDSATAHLDSAADYTSEATAELKRLNDLYGNG